MKSTQESSAKDVKGAIELLESRLGSRITSIQESSARAFKVLTEKLNDAVNANARRKCTTDL